MKKYISVLLVVAMTVALLAGCGAGTADSPTKLSSAGGFAKWFQADRDSALSNKAEPGTYYFKLGSNIIVEQAGQIGNGHTVVIDLNGKTLSAKDQQVFSVTGGKLTLKNGTVESTGADTDGGVISVTGQDSALVLEDVKMSNTDDSTVSTRLYGGVICADDNAAVTLAGATEINGSASGKRDCGGSIAMIGNSQLYITGGTVQNGTAATGGNIYLDEQASLHLSAGSVTGGKTAQGAILAGDGGNISVCGQAQVHMYGGQILSGEATKSGGNISITCQGTDSKAGLYQYGGSIADGVAQARGGNISATDRISLIRIYGGEVKLGQAPLGGNISLHAAAFEMWGGQLAGAGVATNVASGSNIYAIDSTLALYDGNITEGWCSGSGGNIFADSSVMDIYGGSITKGKTEAVGVAAGGGNLYMGGASVLNIYNGEISGGVSNCLFQDASASAPNVMVADQTKMQMFGGAIKDGYMAGKTLRTGCLYVHGRNPGDNCVFHMYGGSMENGKLDATGSVRGMTMASYSNADNDGVAIIRLFDGEHKYTGPSDDPNRQYTIYGNQNDNLVLFDTAKYRGLYYKAATCKDGSHNTQVEDVAATCVTPGYTKYHCDTCGDWCKVTAQATGHNDVTTAVEATEQLGAYIQHSCDACGNAWRTTEQ